MKTLSSLLILLLLFSCKKENSKRWTEVTVRVNNYLTGEPIDNDVSCAIIYYKNYKNPLKEDKDIVLNFGKPVNGVYHYGFKAPKAIQYGVFNWDVEKLHPVNVQQFLYYKTGQKNEFQMYLAPTGFLKQTFKNVNCFDDNDSLYLFYMKNISLPNYTPSSGGYYLTGCNVNIEGEEARYAIGKYVYKWSLTRNGVTQYIIDTVVIEENKSTIYELDY
jgi:hypothetical protein